MKNLIQYFANLFKSKYVSIYTALSDKECIDISGKLDAAGIPHKTKIRGIYAISTLVIGWGRKQSQYDILVKQKDKYKAEEAIQTR